ncbi:YicC/YloC family endoribonuclease [Octadecabacter sp. R77987]|uniref:YicC/YloC family endoribonuclease n=1 Tax=Octadecabacter sp. R77987 TaxID=3093874 RepID=UPI003671BAC8
MINSMTAFASQQGAEGAVSWSAEVRGVNARGFDLRLRLPDGFAALEATLRKDVAARMTRGNVTLNLRLTRAEDANALQLDTAQLDRVLAALDQVQERAFAMGVTLGQPTAADVLTQRGVVTQARADETDNTALIGVLAENLATMLDDFAAMRASEGAALQGIITAQLDQIAKLTEAAASAAQDRRPEVQKNLTTALKRVMQDADDLDQGRVAQELALLAVKADVTEEIDRLRSHVSAARDLVSADGPSGRKLDFLAQEFNREANTLCSKAQSSALTAIGLDLKAVIDQMREQIQNVE